MEEVFLVTYGCTFIGAVLLGLLISWLLDRGSEE